MAILVVGGTGQFGSLVVEELIERSAEVRVQGRKSPPGGVPAGAELVTGDVLDIDFMRDVLSTVSTVFVLSPAVPDELTRSLLILALIQEAGIERVVYLSMMGAEEFVDSPRAAAKFATERALAVRKVPATVLRPNAVFQNDLAQRDALINRQTYATPIGRVGVTMVDNRDVAEVAALELLRRERASEPLPAETLDVVGPEAFTGPSMAQLWSEVLDRPVTYAGDDLAAVENASRKVMSAADAYDLTLVFRPLVRDGVLGSPGAADRLATMLGRPLRDYRTFALDMIEPAP